MNLKIYTALVATLTILGCGGSGRDSVQSKHQAVKKVISQLISLSHATESGLMQSGLSHSSESSYRIAHRSTYGKGRGESYNNDSYFDRAFNLWCIDTSTDESVNTTFWLDEAATLPAGSQLVTRPTSGIYPSTTTTSYNITAGPSSGSHGTSSETEDSETSSSSSFDYYTYKNGSSTGRLQGSEAFASNGSHNWSGRADYADGSSFQIQGTFNEDGSGSETMTQTAATVSADYAADRSGTGKVDAADPNQSATYEWTPDGTTTIHYADGTSETIAP